MSSMDPNAASIPAAAPKGAAKKVTLASVLALAASLSGNVFQWQKSDAELMKLRAETDALVQEQHENATKSVQSWIEQLQKFDDVEDRVMVLSAALSTSPYDSVKQWAREQMSRLEGDLNKRKEEAKQQLALAERAPSTDASGAAATKPVVGGGSGSGGIRPPRPPAGAKPASGGAETLPAVAQVTARQALDRVSLAESMLKAAQLKEPALPAKRPAPADPGAAASAR
jgi:hypothetical protein